VRGRVAEKINAKKKLQNTKLNAKKTAAKSLLPIQKRTKKAAVVIIAIARFR
jgi:hypothetical protein